MAQTFNVRGPAIVSVGVGAANALVSLGYSERGVRCSIQKHWGRIMTDLSGPMVPAELQDFGEIITVRASLIAIDWTYLNTILNRGDRSTAGARNTPGLLMRGSANYAFALAVASGNDAPLYVPNAVVDPECAMAFGTVATPDEITFFGWGYIGPTATTGKDSQVWTRALP